MGRIRMSALLVGAAGALLVAGAGAASADSSAYGIAAGSPGVLSGNLVQIPVDVPINVCGNSLNLIGALNPSFGNSCSNDGDAPSWNHGDHEGWHAGDFGNHHSWDNDQQGHDGWNHDDDCADA